MTRSIPLTLPSGRTVYAEVEDVADPGWTDMSTTGQRKGAAGSVSESFDTLRELLEVAAGKLHGIGPRAPDTVTVEMSVELATGGVVKLLGGSAKGGLKVSLAWTGGGRGGDEAPG